MKFTLITLCSFVFTIYTTVAVAQGGNVMGLIKTVTTTTTTYSSRSVYPSTTMMITKFEFTINGQNKGFVGRNYSEMIPYFKNCDQAMHYINKSIWQDKHEFVAKITGSVMFFVGGIMAFTGKKSPTPGIVVGSTGLGIAIYGMFMQGAAEKNLKRSVKAYNACEAGKSKTGFLHQLVPQNIAIVPVQTTGVKMLPGLHLNWSLNKG
jgi:hypothetical protein